MFKIFLTLSSQEIQSITVELSRINKNRFILRYILENLQNVKDKILKIPGSKQKHRGITIIL